MRILRGLRRSRFSLLVLRIDHWMHGEEDGLPLREVVMVPAVAMGQDSLLSLRHAGFAPPRRPAAAYCRHRPASAAGCRAHRRLEFSPVRLAAFCPAEELRLPDLAG
ncbi:hypothetical protein BHE74_00026574 [Ensete ventricosum]|nr:hypothetical protein BHE74_00026574 [Ensete ventricosum]